MKQSFRLATISLIALAFACFLGKAHESSLRGIDSNIHAEIAMNVTSHGFLPTLPIHYQMWDRPDHIFNDHPFFIFWLNGWVMRIFGPTAWSARLLTATFSVGCILLTLYLGVLFESPLFGVLSAMFLLFCRDFILTGATFSLDMPLLFFILLSFVFWRKKEYVWMGLACGVGLWVKTPMVLLVYPVAFLYSLRGRDKRKCLQPIVASGAFAILIGSLVWIISGVLGGWDLVKDYWFRQVWGTAIQGRGLGFDREWGLFFHTVRTGFIPGLPFLIWGLVNIYRKKKWNEPAVAISLISIVLVAVVVTLMKFKIGYYYNPAFPFLAFLSAYSVKDFLKKREEKFYWYLSASSTVLLAFLLCTPISLGPEAFVALKRFEPLIQSYGSCDDLVYLVPGGEPIGGGLDYKLHISFYTGRKAVAVDCESLQKLLKNGSSKIQWLLISKGNLDSCLTERQETQFKAAFQVGKQVLLTNRISQEEKYVDLTPLEREYKAVSDCKSSEYPKDIFHRW